MRRALLAAACCLTLVACGTDSTNTTNDDKTSDPAALTYPSGDGVLAGYPKKVSVSSIDERLATTYEGQLADGQLVALAPGVYTPFSPVDPDLTAYLSSDTPSDGDCTIKQKYFPATGGSCWSGVQPGGEEPGW